MTAEEAINRLNAIAPDSFGDLDDLARRINRDSADAPAAIARRWSDAGGPEKSTAAAVLAALNDLSIGFWLEAGGAGIERPNVRAMNEAAAAYTVLHERIVKLLESLLERRDRIPQPPVIFEVEEREPPQRECDAAYLLLRRLRRPDESEFAQLLERRVYLRMPDEERDEQIAWYRANRTFKSLTEESP